MFSTKNKSQSHLTCSLTMGSRKFEVVKEFIYLATQITADNNISAEIRRRITLASRSLYGLSKHLRSKMLSRTTKFKVYNTLIVPVLMYGAEAWTLTDSDDMFERKVLRTIYGPVCVDGEWRTRYTRLNVCLKGILRTGEEGVALRLDGKTQFWRTTKSLE